MRRLGKKVLSVATGMTMVAGAVVGLAAPASNEEVKAYLNKAISAYFADGKVNSGELKIVLGDNSFGKEGAAAALIAAAIATKAYTVENVTTGVKAGEETIDPTKYVEVKGGECKVTQQGEPKVVVKITNEQQQTGYEDKSDQAYDFLSKDGSNTDYGTTFDKEGDGTKTYDYNDLPALLKEHTVYLKTNDGNKELKYGEEIELNLSKIEAKYDEDENHHGIYYKVPSGAIKFKIDFTLGGDGIKYENATNYYREPPELEILGHKYLVDLQKLQDQEFVLYSGKDYNIVDKQDINITTNGHNYVVTIEVVKISDNEYGVKATVKGPDGYTDSELIHPESGVEFNNGDDRISVYLKDTYVDKDGNWHATVRIGEGKIKFETGEPFPFDKKWIVDKVEFEDGYLKYITVKNGYEIAYDSATVDDGLKAGSVIPGLKTKEGKEAFEITFPGLGSQSQVDLTNVEFKGINDKDDAVLGVKFTNAKGDVVDITGVTKASDLAIPSSSSDDISKSLDENDAIKDKLNENDVYYYKGTDGLVYLIKPTDLDSKDGEIAFEVYNVSSGKSNTVDVTDQDASSNAKELAPGFKVYYDSKSFKVVSSVTLYDSISNSFDANGVIADSNSKNLNENDVYYYKGTDGLVYLIKPTDLDPSDNKIEFEVYNVSSGESKTVDVTDQNTSENAEELAPGFKVYYDSGSFKVVSSVTLYDVTKAVGVDSLVVSPNKDDYPRGFIAQNNDGVAYYVRVKSITYNSDDKTYTIELELPGSDKVITKTVKLGEEKEVDLGDGAIKFYVTAFKDSDGYKYVLVKAETETGTSFYPDDVEVGDDEKMDKKTYMDLTHMKAFDSSSTPDYTVPYVELNGLVGGSDDIDVVYDASNDYGVDVNNGISYVNTSADTDKDGTGIAIYYIHYIDKNDKKIKEIADQTIDDRNYDENKYQITEETVEVEADGKTAKLVIPDKVRDAVVGITAYNVYNETTKENGTTTETLTEGQEINGVKIVKIEGATCETQATEPTVVAKENITVPKYEEKTIEKVTPIDFDPSDLISFAETGTYTIYVGTPLTNPELAKFKKDFRVKGGLEKSEAVIEGNNLYIIGGSPDAVYEKAKEIAKLLRNL